MYSLSLKRKVSESKSHLHCYQKKYIFSCSIFVKSEAETTFADLQKHHLQGQSSLINHLQEGFPPSKEKKMDRMLKPRRETLCCFLLITKLLERYKKSTREAFLHPNSRKRIIFP